MTRAFIGFIVAIAVLWASNAIAQTAEPQPAAKIVVDPPLAEPLSRGVVFIQYRTENLQIVPVFGPKALDVSPRIGHLHVAVDGAPWVWIADRGMASAANLAWLRQTGRRYIIGAPKSELQFR